VRESKVGAALKLSITHNWRVERTERVIMKIPEAFSYYAGAGEGLILNLIVRRVITTGWKQ
jgi:hypothetical protein